MSAEKIECRAFLALFVLTLAIHGLWYALANPPPGFADNDGYVRLLKVEALWQGNGWFDRSFPRANAPYGDIYHWTRPLDVLISLLALPLVPVFGVKQALYWGGSLSGPALHGAAVAAFAWAALPLIGRTGAILAAIAVAVQYPLIAYGSLVRADHHILYVFLAVLGFGFTIRALAWERANGRSAFYAGLAAAAGVWVGIEGFAVVVPTLAVLGFAWLVGHEPPSAPGIWRFCLGVTLGSAVALAIESGPSFFVAEYDRISIVHATLGVLLALFFFVVGRVQNLLQTPLARAVAATVGAVTVIGAWVLLFPKALRGPLADVDPDFARLLAEDLGELGSVVTLERFPVTLGAAVLAAPWLLWRLARAGPDDSPGRRWGWMYVGLCVAIFAALTAGWARWAVYGALFPCLALGDLIARATERIMAAPNIPPFWRETGSAAVVAFFLLGPLAAGYATALILVPPERKIENAKASGCSGRLLADVLARPPWSDRPRAILMGLNYVGEVLYRTPHHTVGMAYHRSEKALRDTLEAFAAKDDAVVREILTRRNIELVAICPGVATEGLSPESRASGGFYDRLRTGSPPTWVRAIEMPSEAGSFRLFEVPPENERGN